MQLNDPSLLKDKCYINGAWVGDGVDVVTNPANGDEIGKVPNLGGA